MKLTAAPSKKEKLMPFGRMYVLRSFTWTDRKLMTQEINAAIAEFDHPQAAASIACMSNDRDDLHILIECWRENGDTK